VIRKTHEAWLELVARRRLVEDAVEATFALGPGDRALVAAGDTIVPGTPILEHLRDPRVEVVSLRNGDAGVPADPRPGDRWTGALAATGLRRRPAAAEGELLAPDPGSSDRWRIVTGDHRDVHQSPLAGTVREVRPGVRIVITATGRGIVGVLFAGSASRGRLELAASSDGELRPSGIDVGRSGSILVVGSRVDAEALTRARAMGVRGVVAASLTGKDLRDFLASERRQRASLHPTAPFGVLVLDGVLRRPIASPLMALLERLAGHDVALVADPPALVFDVPGVELPHPPADWVRVRHGPNAGREGSLVGLAGMRRFATGVHLEAAWVRLGSGAPVALPLGDLERSI
jgi:hypothetical protein